MAVAIDELRGLVYNHVHGVADFLVDQFLNRAAREFARDSRVDVLHRTVANTPGDAGERPGSFDASELDQQQSEVYRLAWLCGVDESEDADVLGPSFRPSAPNDRAAGYDRPSRTVRWSPLNYSYTHVYIELVMQPIEGFVEISDQLGDWRDGIASLVAARLLSVENRSWTARGMTPKMLFAAHASQLADAIASRSERNTETPLRVRRSPFV